MITKSDIVEQFRQLGLQSGDKVLVHSSIAAIGEVEGGADGVIDALLEAVGPQGMVVVPTFATKRPFDRKTSATPLGAIPDKLWRRPNAVRSLHPTHSVAAIGEGAEKLTKNHEKAPTAYGEGSPFHRLTQMGGKILLLGVDQDRNTTLHTAETLAGAVYLIDIEGTYIDDGGKEVIIPIAAMAGPHRDFIGLDRLFRDRGVMTIGKVGSAVCRLMDSAAMLNVALEALEADPAAVLCDNPACADCTLQRGRIKAARLAKEDFILAATADDISEDPEEIIYALEGEGISAAEMTPDAWIACGPDLQARGFKVAAIRSCAEDVRGAPIAAKLGVPWIVPIGTRNELDAAMGICAKTDARLLVLNSGKPSGFYEALYSSDKPVPGLAFSPSGFANAGEKPFLGVFYKGKLRKHMQQLYIDDATFSGKPALPGRGNGEVKEIVSMLRCRSFEGPIVLRSHLPGVEGFRETAAAFWKLMDEM